VIDHKRLPDGRAFDQIREIWIEAGVLPRAHGSAVFTRGETQALVTTRAAPATTCSVSRALKVKPRNGSLLHYKTSPRSPWEKVGFMRGAGRREIGHGALAERAVSAVLPTLDDWPYAIAGRPPTFWSRNGSSSMATICGASLSLMDAGVPFESASGWRCDGIGEGRRTVRPS